MVTHTVEMKSWIDDATRGLCEDARTRITDEISAQIGRAAAQLQQEGISERDAIVRSVQQLGSSGDARRKFKRIYLTEWESNTFHLLTDAEGEKTQKTLAFVFLYLFGLPFVLLIGIWALHRASLGGVVATLGLVVVLASFGWLVVLATRFKKHVLRRHGAAAVVLLSAGMNALLTLNAALFLAWRIWRFAVIEQGALSDDFLFSFVILPGYVAGGTFATVSFLSMWRKLTRKDISEYAFTNTLSAH